MSADRPNFYELLGIDPSIDDEAELRSILEKQKKRWNQVRTQRTGKKKAEAEAKLGWVEEMSRVFGDPALRRREAEARRAKIEAAKAEAFEALDRRVETLRSTGGCSAEQLETLVGQFAGRLERQEIEARLAAAGVTVGAAAGAAAPFEPRLFLVDSELEEIRHGLGVLGEKDLYTFLGADPGESPKRLVERADRRYKESLGQVDERGTVIQKLAGIAQALFAKPDGKDRYDASSATVPMRQLHGDIDLMVTEGDLRYEAFDVLARAAEAHGVDPKMARSYVGWYVGQRGWGIAEPAEPSSDPSANFEQFVRQMESTLNRFEKERERERQRWEEERKRMAEEAKQAAERAPLPTPPPLPDRVASPATHSLQAPGTLAVEPVEGGFRLTWPPVAGPGVSYWVVRKRGGYPEDEGDGELHEQVLAPPFEDRDVPAGDWFYAVFTLRDHETSPGAAMSGPHRPKKKSKAGKAVRATAAAATVAAGVYAAIFGPPPAISSFFSSSPSTVTPPAGPVTPPPPPAAATIPPVAGDLPAPVAKPKAALPQNPRVAVLGGGDRQIVPVVEERLVHELSQRGLDVVGRGSLLELDDHLDRGGRASLKQLMAGSSLDGIDVLVFADVDQVGERELRFLGRSERAVTSRLGVRAYLVAEQRGLGREWSEQFEYTPINLSQKLDESLYGVGGAVQQAVVDGWSDYRKERGLPP